jgi:hypothetical protein
VLSGFSCSLGLCSRLITFERHELVQKNIRIRCAEALVVQRPDSRNSREYCRIVSLSGLLFVPYDPFDFFTGLICILVAVACCVISPNRLMLFMSVVAVVALRGWFVVAQFPREIRSWMVAVPATILTLVLFQTFGNRSVRQR